MGLFRRMGFVQTTKDSPLYVAQKKQKMGYLKLQRWSSFQVYIHTIHWIIKEENKDTQKGKDTKTAQTTETYNI